MLIPKRGNYYINFPLRSNTASCSNKIIMVVQYNNAETKKKKSCYNRIHIYINVRVHGST